MTSVRDTDRGLNYLRRRAAELANKTEVSVGVPEDAGSYPDGTPVSMVAAAHEFGGGTAPQRSFIRSWFDSKGQGFFGIELTKMAQESLLKGTSLPTAVAAFGARSVKEIQERMDAGISPALQERTIQEKRAAGSSTPETPLEDTHRLRNAITWKVKRG